MRKKGPQYLTAKYLAILETRHGEGFTAFAKKHALAVHQAGDLHIEKLPAVIDAWRKCDRTMPSPVIPATPVSPAPAVVPVPFAKWPRWAMWLHRRRNDGEKGIGDTLARILDRRGGASFKRWFKAITGHDCGCADRQARLNAEYPY